MASSIINDQGSVEDYINQSSSTSPMNSSMGQMEENQPQQEEQLEEQPTEDEKKKIEEAFRSLGKMFDDEDRNSWEVFAQKYKKLRSFWHGFQRIAWDANKKDWITPEQFLELDPKSDIDPDEYNYIINIFKAHGESIIAAISASLPYVRFYPRDADEYKDIIAAAAQSKASEFIQKANEAPILFLHMFWILYTSSFAATYTYYEESDEFGTVKVPILGVSSEVNSSLVCSVCGNQVEESDKTVNGEVTCPTCGETSTPLMSEEIQENPVVSGYENQVQGKQIIEVFSPLEVKIAPYVKKLRDTPYLCLESEQHYTKMRSLYQEIAAKIGPYTGEDENNHRRYRESAESPNNTTSGLVTTRRWWFRPSTFTKFLNDDATDRETYDLLNKFYPSGAYVVFVSGVFAEAIDENVDEYWTITESPLGENVHTDPLGDPVVPLQEMKNETNTLTIETIGYGIGETFVDTDVVDLNKYSKSESGPGMYYPAKAPVGRSLSDGFMSIKPAILSKEVPEFDAKIDKMAEFVSGDMPTVYGGTLQGGSKTLGEYQSSQNRALQRLSTPWKVVNVTWAKTMGKSVACFKKHMKKDENFVKKQGNSFINVWIRKDELEAGEVGQVTHETSDQFPISYPQLRGFLMELLGLNSEPINAAIFHPENAGNVARVLGFDQFHIPGDDSRNKQLMEISELLKGEPQETMMGMPPETTMPIEPEVDDHEIHIETIKAWANSAQGQEARRNNMMGYVNVMAHLSQHIQYMQMSMMGVPPGSEGDVQDIPPSQNQGQNQSNQESGAY